MVPRFSDPTDFMAVQVEDAGFDEGTGTYVTRFRFADQVFRNEFDPKDVPFGMLGQAKAMTNAALLGNFDLDWAGARRMSS